MALVNGSQILARSLRRLRTDTFFYIMGGPMMAHAYGRVKNTLGVCMAASGPGATNLITGVANAWADAAPLLAIGGSAPACPPGKGPFQELDQAAGFRPVNKW